MAPNLNYLCFMLESAFSFGKIEVPLRFSNFFQFLAGLLEREAGLVESKIDFVNKTFLSENQFLMTKIDVTLLKLL